MTQASAARDFRRDTDNIPVNLGGAEMRHAMRRYITGVTILTTLDDSGNLVGLTANSFTTVSLEPPMVLVCVGLQSRSYEYCIRRGRYAINVLTSKQGDVARRFAVRGGSRDDACSWLLSERGIPILAGSLARFECTLAQDVRAGDHAILIGEVGSVFLGDDANPLVFHDGGLFGLGDKRRTN